MRDMAEERWLPVPGFPLYEVSDLGRVRRAAPGSGARAGRILRQFPDHDGYRHLTLRDGRGGKYTKIVHILVLIAFVEARPSPKHEAHHRNSDRADNRAENLEWLTHLDNIRHAVASGHMPSRAGSRNGNAKLTDEQVRGIRDSIGTQASIAERYEVSTSHVSAIRQRTRWADLDDARRVAD